MNFVQILDEAAMKACPSELVDVIGIIRWVINILSFAIPIILIVLSILDIAKIVTAGNIDDKLKKEVTGKITTRLIFAVIIFLVPTIVQLIFRFVPVKDVTINGDDNVKVTWSDCWDAAANPTKPKEE